MSFFEKFLSKYLVYAIVALIGISVFWEVAETFAGGSPSEIIPDSFFGSSEAVISVGELMMAFFVYLAHVGGRIIFEGIFPGALKALALSAVSFVVIAMRLYVPWILEMFELPRGGLMEYLLVSLVDAVALGFAVHSLNSLKTGVNLDQLLALTNAIAEALSIISIATSLGAWAVDVEKLTVAISQGKP